MRGFFVFGEKFAISLVLCFLLQFSAAQNSVQEKLVPQDFFRSPLEIPLNLSGNFGELRTNHFHAGLDIKTEQREGLNVLAAAAGYVSRIKVSPVGYGYAIYVTHPNGYTTVYGHLSKYAPKVDEYVKREQYNVESFSVDLFPDSTLLPVAKGELVGLSGNSGGSGGPHLHFEVRETVTEKVMNPLLFGFEIRDKIPPSISGIWIVPMNDSTWVNGSQVPVSYETKGSSGKCLLKNPAPATLYGDFGFAIHTTDMLDGNTNRCGIYRIEFFVDSVQVYGQRMDRLDFSTNRAMNAHTIYERFKKHRSSIHGSYRLPGNPLDIYDNLVNDGVVSFRDGKMHHCEYRIIDINGNKSSVNFKVQALSTKNGKTPAAKSALARWNWEEDNELITEDVVLSMKARTLYEDTDIHIEKVKKITNAIGPTYHIVSPYEPVHNSFDLKIKADIIKPGFESKVLIARYDPDKERIISEGGKYADGWVHAQPQYLGYFALMIDSVKPSLTNVDFTATMKNRKQFSFSISDALSGIDQIIPKIDGNWALMEYDAKNHRITYYFDERFIAHGNHTFELTIVDGVGNSKMFKSNFVW
jgi:murein DD-endopeptidase MepM/ murein hydrolase activator NlpD